MKTRLKALIAVFLCAALITPALPLAYGEKYDSLEEQGSEPVFEEVVSSEESEATEPNGENDPSDSLELESPKGLQDEVQSLNEEPSFGIRGGDPVIQPEGSFIVSKEYSIATGNDDAYVSSTTTNLTSPFLYLNGNIGATSYSNYLRFTGVDLPDDTVIARAYLSFTTAAASTQPTSIQISGQLGRGDAFRPSIVSFENRRFSSPSSAMQTPTLALNERYNTEDISSILQEIRAISSDQTDYVFKIDGSGFGNLQVRSFENGAATAPKLIIEYYSTKSSYSASIADVWDDAEEYGVGKAISSGNGMEIGGYTTTTLTEPYKEISGFRFPGVSLPSNASITDAYLEFTTYATNNQGRVSNMVIRSELGDAARYQANAGNISNRHYSELAIRYQQTAFTTAGQKVRTPNLKSIIDENRLNGWQSGQALAFMIDGDNYIGSVYQGATAYPARLVIEYEYSDHDIVDGMISDAASLGNLFINEVAPQGTSANQFPWVEIYNANDFAVVLDNKISLGSDSYTTKQSFDNFLIPAKSYRVINTRDIPLSSGELSLLAYYDNSYHVIDSLTLRDRAYQETWGRYTDGNSHLVQYKGGTYSANNEGALPEISYHISHETGMYQEEFAVSIATDSVNSVHYTLDGSEPSKSHGITYSTPISIGSDEVTRLKVYIWNDRTSAGPYSYSYMVGATELDMRSFSKEFAVRTGNDDAAVSLTTVNLASSTLYLNGKIGATSYDNYLRFSGVTLPEDAVITNAYIEFTSSVASTIPTEIRIAGELGVGDAFGPLVSSYQSRRFTSPSAPMTTALLAANQKYRSDNIVDIVNSMRATTAGLENYVFKITGNGLGALNVRSANYNAQSAPRLCLEYYSGYGEVSKVITDYRDDAEEYGLSKAIAINDGMEIGGYFSTTLAPVYKEVAAFRFTGIEIPSDAEITDAYIEFKSLATNQQGRVSNQSIRVELGNPNMYTTASGSISARKYGEMSVDYQQSAFTAALQTIRTPNLRNLIDENRMHGWQSGQALAFLIDGDNYLGSVYYGGSAYAPRLVVEYKFSGRGPYIDGSISDPTLINNVYINEVSSEGTTASKSDWVEFYNANDEPVVLDNEIKLWRDKNKKEAHTFSDFIIPAHGFRVMYFDEDPDAGNDHADFELKGSAELLLVSTAEGTERHIHGLKYESHLYNQTYGLRMDGGQDVVEFAKETFCSSNNLAQEKYELQLSHDRGVYDTGFTLSLASKEGTTIRYTLDGTNPSASSGHVYTEPIPVTQSCMLKVYAYDDTGNSTVNTYTYVLLDNFNNENYYYVSGVQNGHVWLNKDNISSEIYAKAMAEYPIISISSNLPKLAPNADYIQGSFEYLDTHLGGSNYVADVGLKKFGQASITQLNGNTAIRFKRDYNSTKAKYSFFEVSNNVGKFGRLDLKEGQDGPQADVYNLGYLRYDESVVNSLANQMGKIALDTQYVHSFYNGKYMGLKTLREHFNDNMMEDYIGGDSDDYTKIRYQDGSFAGGIVEPGDGLTQMNTKVTSLAAARNFQEFKNYVNVEDFIKTQILYMFIDSEREIDAMVSNDVAEGGRLKMIFNINDTDGAFYNNGGTGTSSSAFAGGGGTYRHKWTFDTVSRFGPGRMFGNFSGDSTSPTAGNLEFKTLVKDQVLEMIGPVGGDYRGAAGAPLSVDNVTQIIAQNQDDLKDSYALDAAFMSYYSNNYDRWQAANTKVLNQVEDRVKFNLQMWERYNMAHTLQAVEVVASSSGLSLSNPNANTTVYYTLDGSDPMGANGLVSPSARVYTSSTVLPSDADLSVRAFTTNNWGPLSYS